MYTVWGVGVGGVGGVAMRFYASKLSIRVWKIQHHIAIQFGECPWSALTITPAKMKNFVGPPMEGSPDSSKNSRRILVIEPERETRHHLMLSGAPLLGDTRPVVLSRTCHSAGSPRE